MNYTYTLVLTNGRIIDPVNGIDTIGDIGLKGPRIVEVGKNLDISSAEKVIDIAGKWVIPGVIDPHVHVSSWLGGYPGLKMMAREGVITALDLAGPPESVFYNVKNYGSGMNIACLNGFCIDKDFGGYDVDLTDSEIKERIRCSIDEGALGVKVLGGHYPLSPETTRKIIKYAADMGIYISFHAGTTMHGSNLEGLKEAIELSNTYPVHIAHINSYCRGSIEDPLYEVAEATNLLQKSSNIWSDSYLSIFNGVSGKCRDGKILEETVKICLRMKGFREDESGLGEAIKLGFAYVVKLQGEENVLVTGDNGYQYWKEQNTDTALSFPVNVSAVQFSLATIKDNKNNFIVDTLSTDGGGIPRNTMIRQGFDLVHYGALTPEDFVKKVSTNAAKMLGLNGKGHLSPGADSDITVIDPDKGKAYMGISLGKIIMVDNIVIGNGGTILTTHKGEESVRRIGVDYTIINTSSALRNKSE
jgi:hypothetical protein